MDFLNITGNLKIPRIPPSASEKNNISIEIKSILKKFIGEVSMKLHNFISTVFTRKKKSGTLRFILNLKHLNSFVAYKHFKMESILDVFKIINEDA